MIHDECFFSVDVIVFILDTCRYSTFLNMKMTSKQFKNHICKAIHKWNYKIVHHKKYK